MTGCDAVPWPHAPSKLMGRTTLFSGNKISSALCLMLLVQFLMCGCNRPTQPGRSTNPSAPTRQTSKTASAKPPAINEASEAKDVAAYVNYYQGQGYKIINNRQSFGAQGQIRLFMFSASRRVGTSSQTVNATINAATHTSSVSSSFESSTTTSY